MRALGVSAQEIDVSAACRQMLEDIGHPAARGEAVYDTTYENVQAGARTSLLFRLANLHDALVIGTGDLSELALGWCTYGVGDQMSHYNVNASVPKTLIQHLIRWCARDARFGAGDRRCAGRYSRDGNFAGADPRGGCAAHGSFRRPLCAAGLQSLLHDTLWLQPRQDSLSVMARLAGRECGRMAVGYRRRRSRRLRSSADQALAHGVYRAASSRRASSSARRCQMARRSVLAVRCRRAGTGARRAIPRRRPGCRR